MSSARPNPIPDNLPTGHALPGRPGAAKAMEFYAEVFGATERMRFPGPDGTVAHAEIQIGDAVLIVEDEAPHRGTKAPPAGGLAGTPVSSSSTSRTSTPSWRGPSNSARRSQRPREPVLRRPGRIHHRPVRARLDGRVPRGGRRARTSWGAGWPPIFQDAEEETSR